MKFTKEYRYANQCRTRIEMEVHDECTLDEILVEFRSFLLACGYVIDNNSVLDIVDMDQ